MYITVNMYWSWGFKNTSGYSRIKTSVEIYKMKLNIILKAIKLFFLIIRYMRIYCIYYLIYLLCNYLIENLKTVHISNLIYTEMFKYSALKSMHCLCNKCRKNKNMFSLIFELKLRYKQYVCNLYMYLFLVCFI